MIAVLRISKRRRSGDRFPSWSSSDLKSLIFQEKIAYKRYKQSKSDVDYNSFSTLRLQCKTLTKECYDLYITNAENSINNDVTFFWNFVHSQSNHNSIPKSMSLNTEKADNGIDISNIFAKYFSTVYNPKSAAKVSTFSKKFQTISGITISALEIKKLL